MTSADNEPKVGGTQISENVGSSNHDKKREKAGSPIQQNSETVDSEQKSIMDYTTVGGIQKRTGRKYADLGRLILKELMDNAIDFVEIKAPDSKKPSIRVRITLRNEIMSLSVSNSNYGKKPFNSKRLQSIFTFDTSFSSKRNQYRITRGYLGDGLKVVSLIPFAIADHHNLTWTHPLRISSGEVNYEITISIDRVNQTINSDVRMLDDAPVSTDRELTEITILLPPAYEVERQDLWTLLVEYAVINTHINFQIEMYQDGREDLVVNLPQTQKLREWQNPLSINCYSLSEFRGFILGLHDKDNLVYDVIRQFREASTLKKTSEWAGLKVDEVKRADDKIAYIYSMLKSSADALPSLKIQTPFEVAKAKRKNAIQSRIEQLGYDISYMNYNLHRGYFPSTDGIGYPFLFEIAIAHVSEEDVWNMLYIESINSSPQFNWAFNGRNAFEWKKGNVVKKESSMYGMLKAAGYSLESGDRKKPPSIVFVNLISPRIDYEDYGKTRINLLPFAAAMARQVQKTAGARVPLQYDTDFGAKKKLTYEDVVEEVLRERLQSLQDNPKLKTTNRWTQSTVFYATRLKLSNRGVTIPSESRGYITSLINKVCRERIGTTREDLGIVAKARAALYFNGEWKAVSLDNLEELKDKGTDLLIVEKEGATEVFAPFADEIGMALMHTGGFLVEYAAKLSELAIKEGCNVAIMTDLDPSGLLMASKVPIFRVGIDFDIVQALGLERKQVEETFNTKGNKHIGPLKDLVDAELFDYISSGKRIEIDSIIQQRGTEELWKAIKNRLEQQFATRDYNRAIAVPEAIIPPEMKALQEELASVITAYLASHTEKIKEGLEDHEGFMEVKKKKEEIEQELQDQVKQDETIKGILARISEIAASLKDKKSTKSR